MVETSETKREGADPRGAGVNASGVDAWFVREVLPLEAVLLQFLRHNWRNNSDVEDLLQDIYVRIYQSAQQQIPALARQFVFTTARNLLIDRVRRERIITIEAVCDLETIDVAADEALAEGGECGPQRSAFEPLK